MDARLRDAVPEMATTVREHRETWPNDGMLYPLVSQIFQLVVEAVRHGDAAARDLACRACALTEQMLLEGTLSVRDYFSIEMLEPLAHDEQHEHYPSLEFAMGPAARKDLQVRNEWGRRYDVTSDALLQANRLVSRDVCLTVGLGASNDTARVAADRALWNQMSESPELLKAQKFLSLFRVLL